MINVEWYYMVLLPWARSKNCKMMPEFGRSRLEGAPASSLIGVLCVDRQRFRRLPATHPSSVIFLISGATRELTRRLEGCAMSPLLRRLFALGLRISTEVDDDDLRWDADAQGTASNEVRPKSGGDDQVALALDDVAVGVA